MASPANPCPQNNDNENPYQYSRLSDEQRTVVDAVVRDRGNAIVNAVAGSGKTRTALTCAITWLDHPSTLSSQSVLLIAYNKRLQQDMKQQQQRAAAWVPANIYRRIEIRTIHGLGNRYFHHHHRHHQNNNNRSTLTTDKELLLWTNINIPPVSSIPPYGLVIIDEAQDLTPILFDFIHSFIARLSTKPQLLILGDPFQLLYRFLGADELFIMDADTKFKSVAKAAPFLNFKLSICFRITHEMASFINRHLNPNNLNRAKEPYSGWFQQYEEQIKRWWGEGIRANPLRSACPESFEYIHRSSLPMNKDWVNEIAQRIDVIFNEYDTNESALISPTIVSSMQSPVRLITNRMSSEHAWYIDDSKAIDDKDIMTINNGILENKRIASTIHKFKGRERDAIVLLGLDSFQENLEKRDPRNTFNLFYVGATRAKKKLMVIQWSDPAYCTHMSRMQHRPDGEQDDYAKIAYEVTKVLDYCPYVPLICDESEQCLTSYHVQHSIDECIPSPLSRNDYIVRGSHAAKRMRTIENVSAIIGVAVEVKLQLLLDDHLEMPKSTYNILEIEDQQQDQHVLGFGIRDNMPKTLVEFIMKLRNYRKERKHYTWAETLKIATAFLTLEDRLYSRWRQIQEFDKWSVVSEEPQKLDALVENLVHLLHHVVLITQEEEEKEDENANENETYEEKVNMLKRLRHDKRILLNDYDISFDMTKNEEFVKVYSTQLNGIPDITLLSSSAARELQALRMNESPYNPLQTTTTTTTTAATKTEKSEDIIDLVSNMEQTQQRRELLPLHMAIKKFCNVKRKPGDVVIVEVKATSKEAHDHLLQLACYGAMWREQSSKVENEIPKLFVAYPTLATLRQVSVHMNSFEFLHRIGFRKLNKPFNPNVFNVTHPASPTHAQKEEDEIEAGNSSEEGEGDDDGEELEDEDANSEDLDQLFGPHIATATESKKSIEIIEID